MIFIVLGALVLKIWPISNCRHAKTKRSRDLKFAEFLSFNNIYIVQVYLIRKNPWHRVYTPVWVGLEWPLNMTLALYNRPLFGGGTWLVRCIGGSGDGGHKFCCRKGSQFYRHHLFVNLGPPFRRKPQPPYCMYWHESWMINIIINYIIVIHEPVVQPTGISLACLACRPFINIYSIHCIHDTMYSWSRHSIAKTTVRPVGQL